MLTSDHRLLVLQVRTARSRVLALGGLLTPVLGSGPERFPVPFVDMSSLRAVERLPGWRGRYFHSESMTFAHYDFVRGSSIHEHFHPQEEVYEVSRDTRYTSCGKPAAGPGASGKDVLCA